MTKIHRSSTTLTDQSFSGTVNVGDVVVQDTTNSWKRRTTEISGLALVVDTTANGIVVCTHGQAKLAGAVAGTTYYLPASGFALSTTVSAYPYGVGKKVDANEDVGIEIFANKIIQDLYVDNTLFVDLTYGNNTTGLRERADRPFATVAAAVTASQANDTIIIRNGNYSIGTVNLTQNINFQFDEGASWIDGTFVMTAGISVNHSGGRISRATGATTRYNINNNITLNINNVDEIFLEAGGCIERVSNAISGAKVFIDCLKITGSTSGTTLGLFQQHTPSGCEFSVNTQSWISSVRCFQSNTSSSCKYNYNIGKLDIIGTGNAHWHDTGSVLANGNELNANIGNVTWMDSTAIRSLFRNGFEYSSIYNIRIGSYEGYGRIFELRNVDSKNYIYCGRAKFLKTSGGYSSGLASGEVTTNPVLLGLPASDTILEFEYADHIYNVSNTISGYGSHDGVIFTASRGGNYYLRGNLWKSAKNEPIGIDTEATVGAFDNVHETKIFYYVERTVREGRDAGLGYSGIFAYDQPVNPCPQLTVNLYGKEYLDFSADGNERLFGYATGSSQQPFIVNIYDEISTNITTLGACVDTWNYLYQPTKVITASGTYSVLDNENDLYYNLTLGNLTLVLPDPAKFVNREIQLKITATHPSNTVVIDPVGAALIENVSTLILPGTSTTLVSAIFKSQGGKWWRK